MGLSSGPVSAKCIHLMNRIEWILYML